MILTHDKWKTFTSRPIPDTGSSEVALCLNFDSRDEVNAFADTAAAYGGTADVNLAQDHGFMFSRSIADLDGHVWEPMWMDPAVASGEAALPEVAQ
jgi:predicted lactoylglutathione lyase